MQALTIAKVDLNVNELRYLIRVLDGVGILGFPDEELASLDSQQREELLASGEQSLLQRNLLVDLGDGKLTISNSLLQAVGAAVYPSFSVWLTSESRHGPVQKWYIHGRNDVASAHTISDADTHHFILLDSPADVASFILEQIDLPTMSLSQSILMRVPVETLVQVDTVLRAGDSGAAFRYLREAQLSSADAQTLVRLLSESEHTSGVIVFSALPIVPVPVTNFTVMVIEHTCYLLHGAEGEPVITIRPVSAEDVERLLVDGLARATSAEA
jgi:hypothetical protein